MNNPAPKPLELKRADADFLVELARTILGNTTVAATTALALKKQGIDTRRVDDLIPFHSIAVRVGEFVVKKVEPDIESPDNFGLFVRRANLSA